mmetsp:Transcript_3509/g.9694  ORF Transcript_3509/g.9694 Transcript_3509/m.9694 type:complete len:218 (+) Transcript_3509:143-796(+)
MHGMIISASLCKTSQSLHSFRVRQLRQIFFFFLGRFIGVFPSRNGCFSPLLSFQDASLDAAAFSFVYNNVLGKEQVIVQTTIFINGFQGFGRDVKSNHFVQRLRIQSLLENIGLELASRLAVTETHFVSKSDVRSIVQTTSRPITTTTDLLLLMEIGWKIVAEKVLDCDATGENRGGALMGGRHLHQRVCEAAPNLTNASSHRGTHRPSLGYCALEK